MRFLSTLAGRAPRLRHLGLTYAAFADEIPDVLAHVPALLKRLEVLDLACGELTTTGAARLLGLRDAMPALRILNLTELLGYPSNHPDITALRAQWPNCQIHG